METRTVVAFSRRISFSVTPTMASFWVVMDRDRELSVEDFVSLVEMAKRELLDGVSEFVSKLSDSGIQTTGVGASDVTYNPSDRMLECEVRFSRRLSPAETMSISEMRAASDRVFHKEQ